MRVFKGIESYEGLGETCLTTGTFDGVHVGHLKIIDQLNKIAKEEGRRSVMLTFFPHPRKVLFPDDHGLRLLTTMDEKLELFEKAGLDDVIIHPFSKEFSRLNAVEYVRDLLVNGLNMKHMVIGYDHHFGRNRKGGIEQLREMSPLYEFHVTEISVKDVDDVNVSSTKIRSALDEGNIEMARAFLGYDYSFEGVVVHGRKRGKQMGYPTANLGSVDDTKLIPRNGVYAVEVVLKGARYKAMMNIGHNPTFDAASPQTIEIHIFDFDADIYGEQIRVFITKYLRTEKRFNNADELINQMNLDKEQALHA